MNKLGDFEIEGRLGRGGFKTVYRGRNLATGSNGYPAAVALCVPHTQDEEAQTLLRNEHRTLAALEHPGIARMLGLERDGDTLFAVMELVEGETVAERLKRGGPLALADSVAIARQVAGALDYAHEALVFHRDVKPANVKAEPDPATPGGWRVKLLDFGLARLLTHSQYLATTRVGSVAYMAPEQFEGAAGMNADVWALGVTFFQMVSNTLPFVAGDESVLVRKILYEAPDLDPLEAGGGDARLVGVVRRALEKEPSKRYRHAGEFANDLEAVLRHAAAVSPLEGELEVLLRARYPLMFIASHEEDRVLGSLERIRQVMAARQPLGLFIWSETLGLRDGAGRQVAAGTAGDPLAALRVAIDAPAEGIYVFLDPHRHFTPISIRFTRDAIWIMKRQRKSLVFISPVLVLPPELEQDATLLSFPPPDGEALAELVTEVHAEVSPSSPPLAGEVRERLARALIGLTRREAARVLRRTALDRDGLTADVVMAVTREKRQAVRKAGVLEFCEPDVGFEDIGGLDNLKAWFAARREAFTPRGARFGLTPPKGAVLVGVPGCGKSLSAKALAKAWGVPLLRLDMGRIRGSRLGESESRLRSALQTAEVASPCILWIDELEKAFAGLGQSQDSGVSQRLFGQFLTWLEDRTAAVFVVATANDVAHLPPEFTRKGRFDETFFVGLPGAQEREAIWRVHLRRPRHIEAQIDLGRLVEASAGHAGAEIAEAVVSAMYAAFDDGERPVRQSDLETAVRGSVPLSRSHAPLLVRLTAWGSQHARMANGTG